MRLIYTVFTLLTVSCVHRTSLPLSSLWCESAPTNVQFTEDQNANFWPVRQERMTEAIDALRGETVIPLRAKQVIRYMPSLDLRQAHNYYLVRASMYGFPDESIESILNDARNARFKLYTDSLGQGIVLTLQHSTEDGTISRNIGLIVRTDLELNSVRVVCAPIR